MAKRDNKKMTEILVLVDKICIKSTSSKIILNSHVPFTCLPAPGDKKFTIYKGDCSVEKKSDVSNVTYNSQNPICYSSYSPLNNMKKSKYILFLYNNIYYL